MHYMRGPCSHKTLAPSTRILDCEFRDWICDYYFRVHVGHGYPEVTVARKANALLLVLMGRSGRQLWIEGHDMGTFRITTYPDDQFFHEDFVKTFGVTF